MTKRVPPERPASYNVEGEYRERDGAAFRVQGRLTVSPENEAVIEGSALLSTAGPIFGHPAGSFHGHLEDGTEIELPHAHLEQLHDRWGDIGSGKTIRLSASGHVDWTSLRAAFEEVLSVDVTISWTLTQSALLWDVAKRYFTFEQDRMSAIGLSHRDVQRAMATPSPNPCMWILDGVGFEVGYFEEKHPLADEFTRYPVRATRFVPQAIAKSRFTGTGSQLVAELARVQSLLDRLLDVIAFLQACRMDWYERTENVEVENPSPPPARGTVHHAARLLVGRFPGTAHDYRRARENGPRLVAHAPAMVQRFGEGEPLVSTAVDVYMLARDAHHVPSRLLLLSTAVESLKELYLRGQPERGTLSDAHWSQVQKALELHLRDVIWKDEYGEKALRGRIKSKMRDLNRPSYRTTLDAMIDAWGVSLDGLVDPFAFIPLRDALVHTGQVPSNDNDALARATRTLETLFVRLMTGWLEGAHREARAGGGS